MNIGRICRAPYAARPSVGEGARRFGGDELAGVAMVTASTSPSLAAIELFVHLEPVQTPDDLVYPATLPEGEPARTLRRQSPPAWWTDNPDGRPDRERGDAWIAERSSLALLVLQFPFGVVECVGESRRIRASPS